MAITEYIVHADDFGYSKSVNECIDNCFENGWLSETSLMVNMPECESAVRLAQKSGYAHCVGLHLNLTEGAPLTDDIKSCSRFCSVDEMFNKKFHMSLVGRAFFSSDETHAVHKEIKAQMERFRGYNGLMLRIDSHHHVHTDWSVYTILKPIAKAFGFKAMRISADLHRVSLGKNLYKMVLNSNIRRHFETTNHFDGIVDGLLSGPGGVTEVMVHPLIWNGVLCDYRKPFAYNIARVFAVNGGVVRKVF